MTRWFRFYSEALDDPKVQMLSPELFKAWVNILCLAAKNDGVIVTLPETAFALRVTEEAFQIIISDLVRRGLLDKAEHHYEPHNWTKRQYKSDTSNERVARYRERQRNVTVTSPEYRDRVQKDISDANASSSEASSDMGVPKPNKRKKEDYRPDFEAFWKAYPTDSCMSKKQASDAWKRLDESARTEVMASLPAFKAYCASKPDYRPVHAVRYITQRRSEGFVQVASKVSEQTFVEKGTPEWEAWQKVRKVTPVRSETHHAEGWWFPSRWPQQQGAAA